MSSKQPKQVRGHTPGQGVLSGLGESPRGMHLKGTGQGESKE